MPLPKAPTTRGERLDIKAASRNKAKLPASRRKKSATAQAEANPALELALDPVATAVAEAVSPAVATASQGRDAGKERAAGKAGGRAQATPPVSSATASATEGTLLMRMKRLPFCSPSSQRRRLAGEVAKASTRLKAPLW